MFKKQKKHSDVVFMWRLKNTICLWDKWSPHSLTHYLFFAVLTVILSFEVPHANSIRENFVRSLRKGDGRASRSNIARCSKSPGAAAPWETKLKESEGEYYMCQIQWLLLKAALETMLLNKQLWEENSDVRAEKGKAELGITAWLWIK